ncbi:MAG: hypothetical protein A2043_05115 [Candidatus Schekmanbacteria bacterium GWA2_38_9]|nr:MAG: hypothetical protein A2043_05115 [Candidatus Schekmanbacteria bacterium GWA2_38_9]OGL51754.1 MAG: hypothetical protein A3H37_11955 [Candidatus Schekmanbacteria bacterium RIFCSPLOWO2_02_FULL_38_14]
MAVFQKKGRNIFPRITLLLKILLLTIVLPVMVKISSLPKLMKILTPQKKKDNFSEEEIDRIVDATTLVLYGRFSIFRPTCLKRSLVLYYLLNKAGLKVVMNFGVKKNNDRLDGHGWLTLGGKPYLETYDPHDSFTVTYSYPQESN